jgi:hypothetical protein
VANIVTFNNARTFGKVQTAASGAGAGAIRPSRP